MTTTKNGRRYDSEAHPPVAIGEAKAQPVHPDDVHFLSVEILRIEEQIKRFGENQARFHDDIRSLLESQAPEMTKTASVRSIQSGGGDVAYNSITRLALKKPSSSRTRRLSRVHINRNSNGSTSSAGLASVESTLTSDDLATRNSFGGACQTAASDKHMLHMMFAIASDESKQTSERFCGLAVNASRSSHSRDLTFEMLLDTIMGAIIVANSLFVGVRMDFENQDSNPSLWFAIDIGFSSLFCLELGLKLWIHGVWGQFCGAYRFSNFFDVFLIILDFGQIIMDSMARAPRVIENAPAASLLRVIRLAKLIRMIRLLKASVFKDLLAMMQGMVGGLSTLAWSMLLFVVTVYIMALICCELFGRKTEFEVFSYFYNVPRSMLTTFRCSFGECTDAHGVPIFEYIADEYGWPFSLLCCAYIFFVTIGIFNVTSAIFVESTMAAANALQSEKRKSRLRDEVLWSTQIATVVQRLLKIANDHDVPPGDDLSKHVESIYYMDMPNSIIDALVDDDEVIAALSLLDIDPDDREHLSDILDPDNGGTINVIELVEGLRRLRGEPRRSDVVTINLILRNIQLRLQDIHSAVKSGAQVNASAV